MWRLIAGQLRYNRWFLVGTFVVEALVMAWLIRTGGDLEALASNLWLWSFTVFAVQHQWLMWRDTREHRAVVWLHVPVRPVSWLGSRMGLQGLLGLGHAALLIAAWGLGTTTMGNPSFADWMSELAPFFHAMPFLLTLVPFSEEIRSWAHPRTELAILIHLAAFVFFIGVFLAIVTEVPFAWVGGLVFALGLGALSVAVQRRRRDFLVVPNLFGYKAKNLSDPEEQFSTR